LWAKPILLYTFSREASALTPASNYVDRSIAFVSPSVSKQENACEQIHLGNVLECLQRTTANVHDVKTAHGLVVCKGSYAVFYIGI